MCVYTNLKLLDITGGGGGGVCLMQDDTTSHIAHTTLSLLQAHALAIQIA